MNSLPFCAMKYRELFRQASSVSFCVPVRAEGCAYELVSFFCRRAFAIDCGGLLP